MSFKLMGLSPISAVPLYLRDLVEIIWSDLFGDIYRDKEIFESKLSNLVGVEYVSTFQSGSLAFYNLFEHLKSKGNEIRKEVILPAYTCPSLCYAIRDAGLIPVFVDIDNTFYPSVKDICAAKSANTLAVLVVHHFGNTSFDLSDLKVKMKVKEKCPYIIEDICQTLGDMKDRINGNFSDYYVLSFGHGKMMTTLNGGAVLSRSHTFSEWAIRGCKSIGRWKIKFIFKFVFIYLAQKDFFYFLVHKYRTLKRRKDKYDLGSYKIPILNDLELNPYQFALGAKMALRLDDFNKIRRRNSNIYRKCFKDTNSLVLPDQNSFFWRYVIIFERESDKLLFKRKLMKQGIYASTGNYPVADEIPEMSEFVASDKYRVAKSISSTVLMLPTHPLVNPNKLMNVLKKNKI